VSAPAHPLKVVIIGASGRMGQSLLRLLPEFPGLQLHAALAGDRSAALGRDSGEFAGGPRNGVPVSADLEAALKDGTLVLDFSTVESSSRTVPMCASSGTPLLLGTTGLGPDMAGPIERAAARIPLLVAANTSFSAALLQELVGRAAGLLGADFKVRVHDRHHRHKRDAPSGTALALGRAVSEASGAIEPVSFSSVREGEVIGEHEVQFMGEGEELSFRHAVTDRAIFARGALRSGLWLVRQRPGSYQMADILKEK